MNTAIILPLVIALFVAGTMIVLDLRRGYLMDRFPTEIHRWAAYAWLTALIVLITIYVSDSSQAGVTALDLEKVSFVSIFSMHAVLVTFLAGWWLLAGRPPIRQWLNIREVNADSILTGFGVGTGGWALTIAVAGAIILMLNQGGLMPENMQPSPMIPWMARFPWWQKVLIVASAMTVEEAFFRGFLQKRIGLIASTILFAVAHAGYGQPVMLIGVTIVSLIIGFTFWKTKNLVPCIITHGVFDAIQLFVIIPLALHFMPQ